MLCTMPIAARAKKCYNIDEKSLTAWLFRTLFLFIKTDHKKGNLS